MITFRDERGSALLLIVGLLMLSVSALLIAVNAAHYFLKKQSLAQALDRTLLISINSYDFNEFIESGEFLDIRLDEAKITSEFPILFASEFPGAEVRGVVVSRNSIEAIVAYEWMPPFTLGEIGGSEILVRATIRSQIVNRGA